MCTRRQGEGKQTTTKKKEQTEGKRVTFAGKAESGNGEGEREDAGVVRHRDRGEEEEEGRARRHTKEKLSETAVDREHCRCANTHAKEQPEKRRRGTPQIMKEGKKGRERVTRALVRGFTPFCFFFFSRCAHAFCTLRWPTQEPSPTGEVGSTSCREVEETRAVKGAGVMREARRRLARRLATLRRCLSGMDEEGGEGKQVNGGKKRKARREKMTKHDQRCVTRRLGSDAKAAGPVSDLSAPPRKRVRTRPCKA